MKKIVIPILILASIILALASQTTQEEPNQIEQTSNLSLENEIKKSYPKPEYDTRLDIDSRARGWYDISDFDEIAANNIGALFLEKIKDYEKAEFWLKKSLSIKKNKKALFNLGLLYENIKKIDESIFFYKKADKMNNKDASYNLAYLYEDLKRYKESEYWYKKAIMRNDLDALKNLSRLYFHNLNDNVQAVKYMLPLSNKKYPKEKLIRFFKIKWNLDDETIKKGYEEQLKAKDIPENLKYKGDL